MKATTKRIAAAITAAAIMAAMPSCFTGVENTGKITQKDVEKVRANKETPEQRFLDSIGPAPFARWKVGKRFLATDNNLRLVLRPQADSLRGRTLVYTGMETIREIDNSEDIVLLFDCDGAEYRYHTGKELREMVETQPDYLVPFLTDLDFVAQADSLLSGRTLYVKTAEWKRSDGATERGMKYVPVVIDSVAAGDAVYPFYVAFSHGDKSSGIFMSSATSPVKNMTFDKLFSFTDIRKNYESISDANWELITNERVAVGMTKDECSLALGQPRSVTRIPTHAGMYERWSYTNGIYLMFDSGLLMDFRR